MPWTLTFRKKQWLKIITCMRLETKWYITLQHIYIIAASRPRGFMWNTFHTWVTSLYVRGGVDPRLMCSLAAELRWVGHLVQHLWGGRGKILNWLKESHSSEFRNGPAASHMQKLGLDSITGGCGSMFGCLLEFSASVDMNGIYEGWNWNLSLAGRGTIKV